MKSIHECLIEVHIMEPESAVNPPFAKKKQELLHQFIIIVAVLQETRNSRAEIHVREML